MTREEAIDELSVIWERLSHPEECENGCYSFRDGDYLEALDMAIEALQEVQKHEETFEWCHDCKEYDKDNHCCHRWSKVIRNTVEELKADTVSREEYNNLLRTKISFANATIRNTAEELKTDRPHGEWKHTITGQPYCSNCEYVFGEDEEFSPFWKYCPMCGARTENKE